VAQIDDADMALVAGYNWCAVVDQRNAYAVTHVPGNHSKRIAMHRLIMGFPAGPVDHIDGDGLNNTRANLRTCTTKQNAMNGRKRAGHSQYRGVRLNDSGKSWRAQIWDGSRWLALGSYATEAEAALAYDAAAIQMRGEFARLNFPTSPAAAASAEPGQGGADVEQASAGSGKGRTS
jgi:hypothetical protein